MGSEHNTKHMRLLLAQEKGFDICSICMRLALKNAFVLSCGHMFCGEPCLRQLVAAATQKCPEKCGRYCGWHSWPSEYQLNFGQSYFGGYCKDCSKTLISCPLCRKSTWAYTVRPASLVLFENVYSCPVPRCNARDMSFDVFASHIAVCATTTRRCGTCREFVRLVDFDEHLGDHNRSHVEDDVKSDVVVVRKADDVTKGAIREVECQAETYRCKSCSYTTSRKHDFNLHANGRTPTIYRCKRCSFATTQYSIFLPHVDRSTGGRGRRTSGTIAENNLNRYPKCWLAGTNAPEGVQTLRVRDTQVPGYVPMCPRRFRKHSKPWKKSKTVPGLNGKRRRRRREPAPPPAVRMCF